MDPDPTQPKPNQPIGERGEMDPGALFGLAQQRAESGKNPRKWSPPSVQELTLLLPQFRIESLIGRGGMGAVYKGVQSALDRPVAIKLLPAEMAADSSFVARFHREARTLAKLHHSGIVAVHDFGQTSAGHLYFVMEYVEGTDLQRILGGPGITPEQSLSLISQICDALHYAHGMGVIHRDIKPANILVAKDGRAKLADFGLAWPGTDQAATLTGTNVIMGTYAYMAPEQREGKADERADIYALGVMLYEMLTGKRPGGVFDPPSYKVQLDIRLDEVVLKALQEEPARRYQHASEMKTEVDHIRTTPPPAVTPQKSPLVPAPRRHRAVAAALLVLIASAVGGFLWEKATPIGSDPPAHGDQQRKLAESVISTGGTVRVFFETESKDISRLEDLPRGKIELDHVDQVSGKFTHQQAGMMAGSDKLRSFRLHRGSFTTIPFGELPALQRVEIAGAQMRADAFASLPQCRNLTSVHLDIPEVTERIVGILAECPRLLDVTLAFSGTTKRDVSPLGRLKNLKMLTLHGVAERPLADESVLEGIREMKTLETLVLSGVTLPESTLGFLPQLKALNDFSLRACEVSHVAYENLARIPRLKHLSISGMAGLGFPETSVTGDMLLAVARSKTLEKLHLNDVVFDAERLTGLPPLPKMKEVTIQGAKAHVSDEVVKALIQACPGIQHLTLQAHDLGIDGITAIAAANSLGKLALKDAGKLDASWMPAIAGITRLTVLNLSGSTLADEHVGSLQGLGKTLKELHIVDTKVTDASIEALKKLSELKILDVRGTQITREGASALQSALPGCQVAF